MVVDTACSVAFETLIHLCDASPGHLRTVSRVGVAVRTFAALRALRMENSEALSGRDIRQYPLVATKTFTVVDRGAAAPGGRGDSKRHAQNLARRELES